MRLRVGVGNVDSFGFLIFSVGIKREHREEINYEISLNVGSVGLGLWE